MGSTMRRVLKLNVKELTYLSEHKVHLIKRKTLKQKFTKWHYRKEEHNERCILCSVK